MPLLKVLVSDYGQLTKRKNKGTKKIESRVPEIIPPVTAIPISFRLTAPANVINN
jgi:hypothetical protein